jgi:ketosteroid isomerase-like protein
MRNKHPRGRLTLPGIGALALTALAACSGNTPEQAQLATDAPKTEAVATSASSTAMTPAAAPAPVNALEVPPALTSALPVDTAPVAATPSAAEDTVRRYYAAVDARDYASAYALWGQDGAASRQTFDAFATGYAKTRTVTAMVGQASAAEGAAGSRFIQVPVELASTRTDGSVRHYRGHYTLRVVMADGATAQQRQWHLDSADLEGYEPTQAPAAPVKSP